MRTRKRKSAFVPLTCCLVWFVVLLHAGAVFAARVPELRGRVNDTAGILEAGTIRRIAGFLENHETETTDQIVVLTVPSLEGQSIESFAIDVFDAWKLGRKELDNGVLVVIAPGERRMRIEVGQGLEDRLTDLEAGRIIRNIMAPRFKAGDFNSGIEQGVRAVVSRLEGKSYQPGQDEKETAAQAPKNADGPLAAFIVYAAGFVILSLFTLPMVCFSPSWWGYFFIMPFWIVYFMGCIGGRTGAIAIIVIMTGLAVIRIRRFSGKNAGYCGSGSGSWRSGSGGGFSGGGGRSGGGGASGGW